MSKLEKLREIASKRTPGVMEADEDTTNSWDVSVKGDFHLCAEGCSEGDSKFYTMSANHFDALLDVAEAAKLEIEQRKLTVFRALSEALARLEAVE